MRFARLQYHQAMLRRRVVLVPVAPIERLFAREAGANIVGGMKHLPQPQRVRHGDHLDVRQIRGTGEEDGLIGCGHGLAARLEDTQVLSAGR